MRDPRNQNLWSEAIGGLVIIAALAAVFILGVIRSEHAKKHNDDEVHVGLSR